MISPISTFNEQYNLCISDTRSVYVHKSTFNINMQPLLDMM